MISRKLIRTDLNLLVALQILLEERNVTRAAERLSVSQPALSKTLQKLRDSFEDELFTRTAHGLVPTPRAEELGEELPGLLETVERVLGHLIVRLIVEARFCILSVMYCGKISIFGIDLIDCLITATLFEHPTRGALMYCRFTVTRNPILCLDFVTEKDGVV